MDTYHIRLGEKTFDVEVADLASGEVQIKVAGQVFSAILQENVPTPPAPVPTSAPPMPLVERPPASRPAAPAATGEKALRAPMPGVMRKILVKMGDQVAVGQKVAVMEAMKMENDLLAPQAGKVTKIAVQVGTTVATGDLIMSFE